MGRSHDYYCTIGKFWWSPFNFSDCPEHGPGECSFYDLNHDAEGKVEPASTSTPEKGERDG